MNQGVSNDRVAEKPLGPLLSFNHDRLSGGLQLTAVSRVDHFKLGKVFRFKGYCHITVL